MKLATKQKTFITPKLVFDSLLEHQGTYFSIILRKPSESNHHVHVHAYGRAGSLVLRPRFGYDQEYLKVFSGNTVTHLSPNSSDDDLWLSYHNMHELAAGGVSVLKSAATYDPIAKALLESYECTKDSLRICSTSIKEFTLSDIEKFIMSHFARE
ncbi:hypothetical protein HY492_01350 [Candidatus Woesearchaeota archaeon]|nr:hypothetical protein [Candidatus Woesearchaeota archaeon]